MADSITEKILHLKNQKTAHDKAAQAVKDLLGKRQNEKTTYSPNPTNPEYSQLDFRMFLTGTVLRVTYKEQNGQTEKYGWLAVAKEKNNPFVFVIEVGGKPYEEKELKGTRFKMRSRGNHDIRTVGEVAEIFFGNRKSDSAQFETVKVDVMEGGIEPQKGKERVVFGEVDLSKPVKQENEADN